MGELGLIYVHNWYLYYHLNNATDLNLLSYLEVSMECFSLSSIWKQKLGFTIKLSITREFPSEHVYVSIDPGNVAPFGY